MVTVNEDGLVPVPAGVVTVTGWAWLRIGTISRSSAGATCPPRMAGHAFEKQFGFFTAGRWEAAVKPAIAARQEACCRSRCPVVLP